AYEEFAALYLELSFFAAPLLPRYFPALGDSGRSAQILAEDLDAPALFAATRLADTSAPVCPPAASASTAQPGGDPASVIPARLLYDLQKVCVDHERPVFSPDLVGWAYAPFRRPLVRLLPDQPLVLAARNLRRAVGRLPSVRAAEAERQALSGLLHGALNEAE